MISFDEARQMAVRGIKQLPSVNCPLLDSVGCVLAADVVSPIDIAPFRNAAVDGYAVKSDWLIGCSSQKPAVLRLSEVVMAGETAKFNATKSCTVKVMTGAMLPDCFDSVIKVEDVWVKSDNVIFNSPVHKGANVRHPAEDLKSGATVLHAGHRLASQEIGILASMGLQMVPVIRKPTIAVASTGNELVEPGTPLRPAQIYDSNLYSMIALLNPFVSTVTTAMRLKDDNKSLDELLQSDADVLVVSGGVSMGDLDLLPNAALRNGWKQVFHKVRVKPGKPLFLGRNDNRLLFGLPGNPLSTLVSALMFVAPALRKLAGRSDAIPLPSQVQFESRHVIPGDRTLVWPAKITQDGTPCVVRLSEKRSSAALSAVLETDGLVVAALTPNDRALETGHFYSWESLLK